jgi:acyl-CoA synthetase (AMP-forming)/AMP-acid ligase II/acyl carrier protein
MMDLPFCLPDVLRTHAERYPDHTAISSLHSSALTYRSLWIVIETAVQQLNALGIGRQDCVAVVVPNGPAMAITFLSVASGAICAPLNPAYREQEFDFYLSDLNAKAIVLPMGIESPAEDAAKKRGIPILRLAPHPSQNTPLFISSIATHVSMVKSGVAGPNDIALVLHTSGTTARPKIVPLTHRSLCTSANNIRTTLQLTSTDRCLNIMPLFHIHGLIGALLSSLTAGAEIVCTPGFQAPHFFDWLYQVHPTWYTAVPTMHQAILARASNRDGMRHSPSMRLIRSSSSALAPQVMLELEQLFNCPVIESYGMTEASHQMASNPLPPNVRKPGSVGIAAGPKISIMNESGEHLPTGGIGEVVIRGGSVFSGYANNPEANEKAFTNGWFRTGDQGYLDADGYLFLTGRLKELINRGGEKIAPREIDEALLDHPAVAQAVAFAVPHPRLGEEIAAAVVLYSGKTATEQELRLIASQRLADFKVPAQILVLEEIPKGPTGKVQRIGLAERLGLGPIDVTPNTRTHEFIAPHTPIEELLAELWRDILRVPRVGVEDTFLELGGDSVLATQFIARVRQTLDINVTLLQFFEASTIRQLAPIIEEHLLSDLDTTPEDI